MKFDRQFVLLLVVAIAVSFALFSGSLTGKFTLDDHSVIEKRAELRELKNLPEVWISPWHPAGQWAGNYRPLTLVSFALNLQFSESTIGFHIVNILLYALNAVFIFYVVRKFAPERAAYLSAVLFLFLPIHSEAVASIVGRVYLLGTLFALLSFLYFFEKKYLLSSLYFYLALFSGDFYVALLPILGLLLILDTGKFWESFKLGLLYYGAPLPAYFLSRYLALGKYAFGGYGFIDPIIGPLAFVSLKERVFTGLVHLFVYLRKTVYPVDLSPDYSFNQIPTVSNLLSSPKAIISLLFFAALILVVFRAEKRLKIAAILFLIPYAIISNIFFITTGTMAERWWYFPSFGLVALAAVVLDRIITKDKKRQAWIYGGLVIVLIWFSSITIRQNHVWLSDQNLFLSAAARSPNSAWARTNIAEGYFSSGNFDKAREELGVSLKISDKNPLALYVLGKLNWKDGKHKEAEEAFKRAIEYDVHGRNKRSLYRALSLLNMDTGNNRQALLYMEEAIKWPPAGEQETILKVDEFLLKTIKEYSNKNMRFYTKEDIQKIGGLIKIMRGF